MQLINKSKEQLKIKVENADDLWYLYNIINTNDFIKGQTLRKIKIGEEERKVKIVKKTIFMKIQVKKIEYKETILKLLGIVVEGPEDIQKGSYHSFNVEEGHTITIEKEKWLRYQLEKIKEAETKKPSILICVLDREECIIAITKIKGYEILTKIKGEVTKKEIDTGKKGNFYPEVEKVIKEYSGRYDVKSVIIASPAFWKEDFLKSVKDKDLKKIFFLATCSSVSNNAIDEVLKRPETKEVLKQIRSSKELGLVEELLKEISKNRNAAYGKKIVKKASDLGAIETLIVSDKFMQKNREAENYAEIDKIMQVVDKTNGKIFIISSEHEGGKKLDSLGGIGAILRYKIE